VVGAQGWRTRVACRGGAQGTIGDPRYRRRQLPISGPPLVRPLAPRATNPPPRLRQAPRHGAVMPCGARLRMLGIILENVSNFATKHGLSWIGLWCLLVIMVRRQLKSPGKRAVNTQKNCLNGRIRIAYNVLFAIIDVLVTYVTNTGLFASQPAVCTSQGEGEHEIYIQPETHQGYGQRP